MDQPASNIWTRAYDDRENLVVDQEQVDSSDSEPQSPVELDEVGEPVVYTSQWATLFIVVNVTIGVGLLAMPFAMQTAGLITSLLLQIFFTLLIIITCIICTELTVKSEVKSYHEIIRKHCHNYAYQATQTAIFLIVFGTTIAYIVTIGDQTDRLFASLHGDTFCHSWCLNRKFIMSLTTILALKPLCSAKTVDFLKYASFLGLITIGFIFYVVMDGFIKADAINSHVHYYPKSWLDMTEILPVFCLGYQSHLSLVPTVATMHRREKSRAFFTVSMAVVLSTIVFGGISIFAVLTFGSAIQKDLTESYSGKNWATLGTIAIVAVKCVLTLPAAFLPARLSLIDIISNAWPRFAQLSERTRRISITVLFLDLALIGALTIPDILVAVNLVGCIAVMFIFQLPGLAYLSLVKQNRLEKQTAAGQSSEIPVYTSKDRMKRYISYFLIVFGTLMTLVVLYKSFLEILDNKPTPPLCK